MNNSIDGNIYIFNGEFFNDPEAAPTAFKGLRCIVVGNEPSPYNFFDRMCAIIDDDDEIEKATGISADELREALGANDNGRLLVEAWHTDLTVLETGSPAIDRRIHGTRQLLINNED